MDWQPIETAPQDGKSDVLLWPGQKGSPYIARLEPRGSTQGDTTKPRAVFLGMYCLCPTHWMPLPPPPIDAKLKETV
jgi:hypothetical protein